MPEFTLELREKELFFAAPDTPTIGPATRVEFKIGGQKRAFLGRIVRSFDGSGHALFFRPENAADRVFGYKHRVYFKRDTPVLNAKNLQSKIRRCLGAYSLYRFWQAPDSPCCFALSSNGDGFIWRRKAAGLALTPFIWRESEVEIYDPFKVDWRSFMAQREAAISDFLNRSEADFRASCERLFANETSDFRFAHDWQFLEPQDKNARTFYCENGEWDEMQRIFEAIFFIAVQIFGFKRPEQNWEAWTFTDTKKHRDAPLSPREQYLARWQQIIFALMRPNLAFMHSNFDAQTPYYPNRCIERWCSENSERQSVWYDEPSAHELMEAPLKLRDFLRDKIPEAQIESLLRHL